MEYITIRHLECDVVDWRIYYDGGLTFDSTQGRPLNAPALGVLVIVERNPDCGRLLLHGFDYYLCVGGEWLGADWFGVMDWVLNRLNSLEAVKAGRSVPAHEFEDVMRRAGDDPDFPAKSAKSGREHPFSNQGRIEK